MTIHSALLVVDMQNDFLPGGALPVENGDRVIPVLNRYIERFQSMERSLFYSRDWHPPETAHFREHGGPWPPHCVQDTVGAEFAPELEVASEGIVVSKGMGWDAKSYSAFLAQDDEGTHLEDLLRERNIAELYVGGLALDYCVKFSVLDALKMGLATTLLIDATRAVNVETHDAEDAVEEMVRAGARVATFERIFGEEEAA